MIPSAPVFDLSHVKLALITNPPQQQRDKRKNTDQAARTRLSSDAYLRGVRK